MKECPVCGASIPVLVECLKSPAWENRTMALVIMDNCRTCEVLVKEVIKREAVSDSSLLFRTLLTASK